ncbi:MAG: cobyric acid synthase [Thaumarchaeota archaeon]|nr:MAG: cobyric acid synthase CobQ [Thaumarchaeota archaeon 13_1_40CM_3_38_6]OLD32228.1 MAG: cobyric acid synthase CobQ [Thaumarchaeota archaeon 13_1_40CM_2_39_13_2]OLE40880.1 MAG: cobyric acid synthase CobQ [Thaumarchaeota archaeon 13_1_20CM_2_39_20]TLX93045.1 MAG: cobyric acid synthase [Nitrososphaerota archaeon]
MIQGTSSGAGKTTLVTALCRIFSDKGYRVAPFKSQNMSSYSYIGNDFEIARAQAIQAIAARANIDPKMNPILLKPIGNYRSEVFVNGKFYKKMHASEYYKKFALTTGLSTSKESLDVLRRKYDIVILEGAGSPAEINLARYDIANMRMAEYCSAPVILVTDIDKGGSFASIIGTMALLEKKYQRLIKGFVINKFRGDIEILRTSFSLLRKKTMKPVLGVIPLLKFDIPDEDSLDAKLKHVSWTKKYMQSLDVEIANLSRKVRKNLDMKALGVLLK